MDRKDPLEGSLLGSGWKACIRAQHSASTLPAGKSLSSQTWPGLYLSWAEVPSSFPPAPRLKPQLKHETEEMSSKLYPIWGCHNLWHPVTSTRGRRIWRREENHFCITSTEAIWLPMEHKNINYICKQSITVCVLAVSNSIKDKKIWCPVSVNTMPRNVISDLRGNKIKAPHAQEQECDESACHPLVSSVSL